MPVRSTLSFVSAIALALTTALAAAQTTTAHQLQQTFGKVPLSFEPNQGQTSPGVDFVARGPGYGLFLTHSGAVLQLKGAEMPDYNLHMDLVNSNTEASGRGANRLPGTVNYFIGSDAAQWHTGISTYQNVRYAGVYPGIDLVYYGNQRQLEYDFVVAPHADPARIALQFTGAAPQLSSTGDLVLVLGGREARFHKPVVYQMNGERRVPVQGTYQLAEGRVRFKLGSYDHEKALVIDPVLSYLTYIGGSSNDVINGIAVDGSGSAYIVASTSSIDYPVKSPYQATNVGSTIDSRNSSIAVSKFNPAGTALVYSTFIGGSDNSLGNGIAIDSTGNAYIGGYTNSGDYPVTANAFQKLCGGANTVPAGSSTGVRASGCPLHSAGDTAGVLTKLNPAGNALVYSTFFSGNNYNSINAVAVNSAGEAYVAGLTNSFCNTGNYGPNGTGYQAYDCLPTTAGAVQFGVQDLTGGGGTRNFAFVSKFDAAGANLLYSSLLGPTTSAQSTTNPHAIAVDNAGNAYVAGSSNSNMLVTPGAYQTVIPTTRTGAFIAKFDTTAHALIYSTFLAGTTIGSESANGIAIDASGNAYIAGSTQDCAFPTTVGAYATQAGAAPGTNTYCTAGFVTKLNPTGTGLVWSTFLGNQATVNNNAALAAIALGSDNSVYVAGSVQGGGFPTLNPVLPQGNFSNTGVVSHLNASGSTLLFSSTIGSPNACTEPATAIALDSSGNIYVAGVANGCSALPTTAGAFQRTGSNPGNGQADDGWVAKIAATFTSTTALTLPGTNPTAGQSVLLSAKVTGQSGSTGTPTGTVTFLSGSTVLGTGAVNSSGIATYTAASLGATTYSVTASYAGDSAFSASVSAAQNLVVSPATPTVTLTAPATANIGANVTLTSAVSGSAGTATGTVTFKDGTTTLGTATLASGSATLTTSTLALGTHTITASYGGDTNYASAVSTASTVNIAVAPSISFAASPSTLTIAHGGTGSVTITGTPVGGYAGTVTFACGALPAAASCSFAPASFTFTGNNTPQTTTLTISTSMSASLDRPTLGRSSSGVVFAVLLLPVGWFARSRRGRLSSLLTILVLLVGSLGALTLSGCSSSPAKTTTTTTPAGAYTVSVAITATSGSNQSLSIPITVQ